VLAHDHDRLAACRTRARSLKAPFITVLSITHATAAA
jgi:hypothetical protein